MVLLFITQLTTGVRLACWIGRLWQWFFGADASRFEGEKIIYW
jgi:hypothetical protein